MYKVGDTVMNNGTSNRRNKGKIAVIQVVAKGTYTVREAGKNYNTIWVHESCVPQKEEENTSTRYTASTRVQVSEKRRQIVFVDGQRLDLHNVTAFDPSGTQLRLWSDEGIAIVNPVNVNYHLIKKPRADEQ